MTDKETLVQLALNTFPEELLLKLITETTNPDILKAAARFYSVTGPYSNYIKFLHLHTIYSAFMDNPHTTPPITEYVELTRRMQSRKIQSKENLELPTDKQILLRHQQLHEELFSH